MGRASSSKKVARAARAAGRGKSSRNIAWPLALVVVIGLGTFLIILSRPEPSEAEPPTIGDHWHAAYGLYACDGFLPPLADVPPDTSGIHTHEDGLIHIHPFSTRYTGDGANLGAFAEQVGMELTDQSFRLPSGQAYENGDDCGGEPGVVQVKVWESAFDAEGRLLDADFASYAPPDSSLVTIAFAPAGAEIPKPPSAGTVPGDLPGAAPVGGGSAPGEQVPAPPDGPPEEGEAPGTTVPGGGEAPEGGGGPQGEVPPEGTAPEGDGAATTAP